MDEDERQRKLEAGRAKNLSSIPRRQALASFRQKRAKNDSAGSSKKTQKRKGQTVQKNDGSTQDHNVEAAPPSESVTELDNKTDYEGAPKLEQLEGQQNENQEDQPPLEDLRDEALAMLTGREQLKQLQEAVEKRNEIIAKLSYNLQEALASRDQVQLEAQSLTGQIQALQKQIQQTSVEFKRIKGQSGAEAVDVVEHHHGLSSQASNISHKEVTSKELGNASPECFSTDSDTETDTVLHKLMTELEEERKNNQRISVELAKEMEKNQRVLLLLEVEKQGREEERKTKDAQLQNLQTHLSEVQTQCLEIQQFKEEKEKLNQEVLKLRKKLEEEGDAERRHSEDAASSALCLQAFEDEKLRQEEELTRLKEEVELVRQLLDESKTELKRREVEVEGLKVSKNRQNQVKAGFSSESISTDEAKCESGLDQERMNTSLPGDTLMERYLSSAAVVQSQSSAMNESFEHCSQLNVSADCSFELNSEVFGDQSLLSISNRICDENENAPNVTNSPCCAPEAGDSSSQSLAPWPHNTTCGEMGLSQMSEQPFGDTGLEKDLLKQQCEELHEELVLKECDLNVLQEEVMKSSEELEEARSRWAQVTEELRQALAELEEEKAKRRNIEEEINLKAHEQENLINKLGALIENNEDAAVLMGQEAESPSETYSLVFATFPLEEKDTLAEDLNGEKKKDVVLSNRNQQKLLQVSSLREVEPSKFFAKGTTKPRSDIHLQTLTVYCDHLISKLEETKSELKTSSTLLNQKTAELDAVSEELKTTRAQALQIRTEVERLQQELSKSHESLNCAEKEKNKLDSQISCLKQSLAHLDEAQAQAVKQTEENKKREQQMDEQIKKMEQVLEEELEQFENILKAKDIELAEEREKWEEEKQEKEKLFHVTHLLEEQMKEKEEEVKALLEKQVLAVKEATEKLKASHQQEIKDLMEKHQEEISELNANLETELQKQQVGMEEEQTRQISLIKQVTEREHERMISELTAKHNEELDRLRTEVSLELRESMETAHQAELQQAQAQKTLELEALRLSLTTIHTSQLEYSQMNVQQEQESALSKVQDSMQETFTQELSLLEARHRSDLNQIKQQSQEQQDRLLELHKQELDELKQQWETRTAQERALMEEKQTKEMQALTVQWETEAEQNVQRSLSEIKNCLNATQTELSSKQTSLTEMSKALTDAKAALSQTQSELQETKNRLEELQITSKDQVQKLEEELKQACTGRDAAACSLEEMVFSHRTVLQEKEQQVLHLEAKEQQLQQEVLRLKEEKKVLKESKEQEMGHLWTQLESMRTSRQELGELKEQLLARSSQVDDIERLKTEFNEQKREIKKQNEAELENLRSYFEKRLHASEESYKEEIALLQLRLIESALEDSVLQTTDDNILSQVKDEKDKDVSSDSVSLEKQKELLDALKLELERTHAMELSNLQSTLTLSFKEELDQERSNLTDHYYKELQEVKARHALELEQLRAKLSDSHLKELTRVQLDAARQVEVELEQRTWCLTEELQTRITLLHILENRLTSLSKQQDAETQSNAKKRTLLEEALKEETDGVQEKMKKLKEELQQEHENEISALKSVFEEERTSLRKAIDKMKMLKSELFDLDNSESPQVVLIKQRLEVQYENELQKAKNCMSAEMKEFTALLQEQSEEKLRLAQQSFQEEKATLEEHLFQNYETSVGELKTKHKAELECERAALLNKHSKELTELDAKHKAQLESLSASHRNQLTAMTVELESEHNAKLVALEASLKSKQKEDLESLKAAYQETNQAKLEALEADLARKHQEDRDELERRMLGNMDTLETTYLMEVQALRDEIIQLEERHHQGLLCQSAEHKQLKERQAAEQVSIQEELRKELAQVHMEKFRAMAAELSHVHKAELAAQKEALDSEHCKALESLKKQVLELEQQHSAALQELSQTYTSEKEHLIEQHQLHLQELKAASACELEACHRELEEELSRQQQHFLKEVEFLKVQSEEQLQDRINQLKTESDEQKEAELEDLRRSFTAEQQEKEQSYTNKMSQLTAQLQQLDAVVTQLRAEVRCLQEELQGKHSEMETMDTLLQRRERESQEGGNLLKMLTDDLQAAKEERHRLHDANEKLSKVLIEMLRSLTATEELIGQKINIRTTKKELVTQRRSSAGNKDAQESGISVADMTSEDSELTQLLCESLLVSDSQLNPAGEESALNACNKLRHTVDTLLDLLNQANTQLEQTRSVHLSLEEKFSQNNEDTTQLVEQHKLLMKQLDQEAKLKTQLQVELHKAEGLLEGYVAEKATLEESLQQKEAQEEKLVEELEGLKVKLHHLQSVTTELESLRVKYQDLSEEHTLLLRQKEHLSAGLGEREKALLTETERLTQEKLDLQRQAEKDRSSMSQRLRTLERELEDQETKDLEKELHHKTHTEDLSQRVQALEKQLKHNRQFIEEQAVEREHERDEFQQEICRLEAQLKHTANVDNKGHRFEDLVLQVENLQSKLKDKTEDRVSLLAANQQTQRELAERNEEIDKLAGRIRELEQALLNNAESVRTVSHLEQELHKAKLREQELIQDKLALEQQQLSSRLQISALQSKLDETRHCYHDNTRDPTEELRDALDAARQNLHSKEQEVEVLVGQLENVQRDLSIKEVELKHLALQLELITNKSTAQVQELQEQIAALNEKVLALSILEENEELVQIKGTEEQTLPTALLQEKNQEIDHLNCEIQRLEQQLENARNDKVLEVELEDLRSQVEHLQSENSRVRHEKQEEEERLHEVISTLQAELATLGPNLHEVSDSQDGDSINPSPAPSPEPQQYLQEQERRGKPKSLKQEISLTNSAACSSLRSRLKVLQSQFETAVAEKEGLERLLLTQEEEYRGQVEEFGKRLSTEREKSNDVQGLLTMKEAELKEVKAIVEEEREKRKLSEEERNHWRVQAEESNTLREEKAHLNALILDLQKNEQDIKREIENLKAKEQEVTQDMEDLRKNSLSFERQVQELRAEKVDMEKLVNEGRERIKTLEAAKEELFVKHEALQRRESQLQEELERLRQEVASMKVLVQDLTSKLNEKETNQEEAQKDALTHADVTLAKADTALRQKEAELAKLRTEYETLRTELAAVKQGLSTTTEWAEILNQEGQTKDRALVDLETENKQLKVKLQQLQEDLALQEEELVYEGELQRQQCHQQDTPLHHQNYTQKDVSHRGFQGVLTVSHEEASLSSPEVLRKLECSEDRLPERFQTSALDSRLFELSGMNSTGLDPPQIKPSPKVVMEPPHSRTITPDPNTQTTLSPGSLSGSDNFSVLNSADADKVHELEEFELTAPPSLLGSTSSLSAQEWNTSDGYGSNVSSELGARLRAELEQTERLDAQFIQYLRCRGMNPTVNTDSAAGSMSYSDDLLSPELQGLLKKVYEESCRILTLSQRQTAPLAQPHISELKAFSRSRVQYDSEGRSAQMDHREEAPTSQPPMTWQQEKRALQETVIALRELLCRMAQRQTDYIDDNWNQSQLQAGGQAESHLRTELEESQKQLKCAHNALQEQNNKSLSLRLTMEEGEESLRREQTRVKELQQELEQERALIVRKAREEEERREAFHISTEKHRSDIMTLKGQLEQEKVACSNLRQELQIEQSRSSLLEKHSEDAQKLLEDERQRFAQQQDCSLQEKSRVERLLHEAESRLAEFHSKLADSHKKLDEESDRWSRQVDELSRRHEADSARDGKFISDLRSQLEKERRHGEELAVEMDRLRAELLQSRRKWEEEDKTRQEQLQREQEVATRHRLALKTLSEQKQELTCALEGEREQSKHQGAELAELKERLRMLKEKEREREEQMERERRKGRQEQMERELRQDRTNNKLLELESLRRQDQQRVQELQRTLTELERDEREMAAQRLSGWRSGQQHKSPSAQPLVPVSLGVTAQTDISQQQTASPSSSNTLEALLKKNLELTEHVTLLSQEKNTYKNRLICLEKQLRRTESELATVTTEMENRPINDASSSRLQRYYERYLRAESFRKALVYQKRYLLLLLGGFQDCEQATLCLIARMGARPSTPLTSQRKPLGRFRSTVRVVIAVSRMRFLTRKWQRAIRRFPSSGNANGHIPAGCKADVFRQQQPRSNSDSTQNRDNGAQRQAVSSVVPPSKSSFRLHIRSYSSSNLASTRSSGTTQDPERSLTEYIHHLEKVQQRLVGARQGSSDPKLSQPLQD